jgi:hypothetical protein
VLAVLTIVSGVVIVAPGRLAGQSPQHRRRDADEQHVSESEADGDGGQRQPDPLKPVFNHVFLVRQKKTPPGSHMGRNAPGGDPGAITGDMKASASSSRVLPAVKPPWRKATDQWEK